MKRRYAISTLFILTAVVAVAIRIGMFLDPRASIQGNVVTTDSQPVANVRVLIRSTPNNTVAEQFTDKHGRYHVRSIKPGGYSVSIDDDDWVNLRQELISAEKGYNQAPELSVTRGATVSVRLYDGETGDPCDNGSFVTTYHLVLPNYPKVTPIAKDAAATCQAV